MRTLYLYLLVVCCTLQSCSSFLEETPYNKITAGQFFYDSKGGRARGEWLVFSFEGIV